MMARFDLIIFDCDGVVVDSERIVHEVFGDFMRSLGMNLSDEEMFERFLGRRARRLRAPSSSESTGRPVPRGALDRYTRSAIACCASKCNADRRESAPCSRA